MKKSFEKNAKGRSGFFSWVLFTISLLMGLSPFAYTDAVASNPKRAMLQRLQKSKKAGNTKKLRTISSQVFVALPRYTNSSCRE